MNRKMKWLFFAALTTAVFTLSIIGVRNVLAQGGYEINWWTIDGGGGESTGGDFTLNGTIGQHDAGKLEGGEYTLQGGFWVKGILEEIYEFIVNIPLIFR